MSLKSTFNSTNIGHYFTKVSDHQLEVRILTHNGPNVLTTYDFLARLMYATASSSASSVSVTPFSQIDREALEFFHGKLIDLNGKPPELPPFAGTDSFMGLKSEPAAKKKASHWGNPASCLTIVEKLNCFHERSENIFHFYHVAAFRLRNLAANVHEGLGFQAAHLRSSRHGGAASARR